MDKSSTSASQPNNRLLSPVSPNGMNTSSNSPRSPSHSPSRSRVTLVEENPEIVIPREKNTDELIDTYKIRTIAQPTYTWFDHLRGVFFLKNKKGPIVTEELVKPVCNQKDTVYEESPWVLPVHVLSSRVDSTSHSIPKLARCTIDTGNLQGNVVSREFVEKVLEYSEENFSKLTKDEELGATGITGHTLIPDSAIYLTWYHEKSTRVFRNMRFLISPIKNYDLIIGARSIKKDNILDVPNLMATPHISRTFDNVKTESEESQKISGKIRHLEKAIGDKKTKKGKMVTGPEKNAVKKEIDTMEEQLAIENVNLRIHKAEQEPQDKKRDKEIDELKAERKRLPGYKEPSKPITMLPKSDTTHSTGSQVNGKTSSEGRTTSSRPSRRREKAAVLPAV